MIKDAAVFNFLSMANSVGPTICKCIQFSNYNVRFEQDLFNFQLSVEKDIIELHRMRYIYTKWYDRVIYKPASLKRSMREDFLQQWKICLICKYLELFCIKGTVNVYRLDLELFNKIEFIIYIVHIVS
jgi:hypothetical protein